MTQEHTELVEIQGGPVESKGTGWRQRPNIDSAVSIQTPQSIKAGSQLGQLHLRGTRKSAELTGSPAKPELENWVFTSGGRGTEEGLSCPSWSHTQKRSFLL